MVLKLVKAKRVMRNCNRQRLSPRNADRSTYCSTYC